MCEFCENDKIRRLKYSKINPVDYIGKRFGRAVITDCYWVMVKNRSRLMADYRCDCGKNKTGNFEHLKSGRIISCGCMKSERYTKRNIKHGLFNENQRLYGVWNTMVQRCSNPNVKNYCEYGGRGILVCDEWLGDNGFENFYRWAMENGYEKNAERGECTIDRIDVNGNYEPSNCRWVDMFTQVHNRRPYGTCKIGMAES